MKSENIVCEEWKGYRPNMPVKVVGVSNGKITSNGNGVEIFKNLKDAQKKYSDLDPKENTKRFTWVMYDEIKGRDAGRFETWQAERVYSMEEQVFQDTMKSENIVCEEWKGYRPNMPVQVVGVKNGKITSNGSGVEYFDDLNDAKRKYKDLDPKSNSKRFTWVTSGEAHGKPCRTI